MDRDSLDELDLMLDRLDTVISSAKSSSTQLSPNGCKTAAGLCKRAGEVADQMRTWIEDRRTALALDGAYR